MRLAPRTRRFDGLASDAGDLTKQIGGAPRGRRPPREAWRFDPQNGFTSDLIRGKSKSRVHGRSGEGSAFGRLR